MTLKQKKLSRNGYFIDKSNEYKFIYVLSLIHRPSRELTRIFYYTWVKPVCCFPKISSDCGCQSKEIGVGVEVRLLSVGARGFFLTASRLAFAASPLNYGGLLWTKYRICIYPCYVAYMNAMRNKSISKYVLYKLKVSDKTKRCSTQVKDVR